MSSFIITDKGLIDTNQSGNIQLNADRSVYEVIRLIDGVALFLEDHYERLLTSARKSGIQLNMPLSELQMSIEQLIKENKQSIGNIKFLLSTTATTNHWLLSFIPHSYPSDKDYEIGVPAGLLNAERLNPEAKVIQQSVREKADQLLTDKKLYEVLLVDRNGAITEGSRSNVFFVKNNCFYTAPASMVLLGVTRKKVLECLNELNCQVIEEAVREYEVSIYDAVFLTGTSPKVLPINAIDEFSFKTGHPMVLELMSQYNKKISEYIQSKKG